MIATAALAAASGLDQDQFWKKHPIPKTRAPITAPTRIGDSTYATLRMD
jgi:hypothetical protein